MAIQDITDLDTFLSSFPAPIREMVFWLRSFVWKMYPESNELIYDNYNAVAFGWSLTDRLSHLFCSIAVGRSTNNIHFGFYYGNELTDPDKILIGKGKQYRYILVIDKKTFPKTYLKKLISQAYVHSLAKVKENQIVVEGKTIVKSVSVKKRGSAKGA